MFALIAAALAAIGCSLWIRRHTWRSRWEADASLSIALQGAALVLMSPWASATFSRSLYRVVGLWNIEDLFGHICLVVSVMAITHHGLTRLSHDEGQLRSLFRRQVVAPASLGVLLLVATFTIAEEGYHDDLFSAHLEDVWLGAYWLVLGGLLIYLLAYAIRVLLILRHDARATATADMYLTAAAFGLATHAIQMGTAWTGNDVTLPVWLCACLGAAAFAYGSARSWQAKVRWFRRADPPPAIPPTASV